MHILNHLAVHSSCPDQSFIASCTAVTADISYLALSDCTNTKHNIGISYLSFPSLPFHFVLIFFQIYDFMLRATCQCLELVKLTIPSTSRSSYVPLSFVAHTPHLAAYLAASSWQNVSNFINTALHFLRRRY